MAAGVSGPATGPLRAGTCSRALSVTVIVRPFYPGDRFLKPCDHEPEYQAQGQCVRCGMVTSLNEFRRVNGAPEVPGGQRACEPFRLLDRAFTRQCAHEPPFQMYGACLRCGMVTSLEEALRGEQRYRPGQPSSSRRGCAGHRCRRPEAEREVRP